jgi:hypothetical protein
VCLCVDRIFSSSARSRVCNRRDRKPIRNDKGLYRLHRANSYHKRYMKTRISGSSVGPGCLFKRRDVVSRGCNLFQQSLYRLRFKMRSIALLIARKRSALAISIVCAEVAYHACHIDVLQDRLDDVREN